MPLAEEAYSRLEELIVTMKLRPGLTVSEGQLSDELGIGRTPIREALQRLSAQKLIKVLPQRGIMVSEIDVKAQLRLLEVRRELERLVMRCAARRATEEERERFRTLDEAFETCAMAGDAELFMRHDRAFNDLCIVAGRNEFAAGSMNLINSLSRRFWYLHYQQVADLPLTARLHAGVARAIAAGDEDGAAKASDLLLNAIEAFTRATVSTDF
jgi:DNA-binding GntR family transcriptional regulator